MFRGYQILVLGVVVAALAYAGFYLAGTARSRQMLHSPQPELAWLKQEYHLSDAEFARISKLHNAYLPQCEARCRKIAEVSAKLEKALAGASGVTPEIKELLAERANMRAQCQAEMLEHFFAVSRTMPPEEGRRYLAWVQQQTCFEDTMMAGHEMPTGTAHH